MKTHVRCGTLFSAVDQEARSGQTLVYDARGVLEFVGPTAQAPKAAPGEQVLDYSRHFVMPGLIDVHVHLAYGNAKSEEDIDLYSPLEFRALRGLFFAQKLLAAGYTALCSPGDAGQVSLSIRNAIRAGLFDGPRISAAGPYISARQSLTDWYPSWIGAPSTSIGRLVASRDEAIEEIRVQAKNGVDCVKIALDGIQRRPDGSLIAAFTQDETAAMVSEIQRLGRKAVVHAIGREAVLYAARAGVDLIFHAFDLDDECIDAVLEERLGHRAHPHLPAQHHGVHPAARAGDDQRPRRPCAAPVRARLPQPRQGPQGRRADDGRHRFGLCGHALRRMARARARDLRERSRLHPGRGAAARRPGPTRAFSPMATGSAGSSPAATPISSRSTARRSRTYRSCSTRAGSMPCYLGGKRMALPERDYDPREVTDQALVSWTDVYTQARVAELRRDKPLRRAAE